MFLNFFWRRLLRVPWTTKNSNQSILKEINLEYSLEGLMLKLKLQYFGHLMQRTDSLEKTPMLGKIEGRRRTGQQKMRWLMASPTRWTWVWASSGSWWWIGKPGVVQSMRLQRVGHNWVTGLKWLQRWYVVLVENFLFIDKQKWNKMKKTINLNLPWGLSSSLGTLAYCSVKIKIR